MVGELITVGKSDVKDIVFRVEVAQSFFSVLVEWDFPFKAGLQRGYQAQDELMGFGK